jgi:predicted nucleic acid-binding protein
MTEALRHRYARHLVGVAPAIAAQTVVELRYGALASTWGPRRMEQLQRLLDRAVIIPVDDEVMWTHARLRLACRRVGHPLNEKTHAGDLWIAASAVAHNLPLVSDDGIFAGVPGLEFIHEGT